VGKGGGIRAWWARRALSQLAKIRFRVHTSPSGGPFRTLLGTARSREDPTLLSSRFSHRSSGRRRQPRPSA
jgi:hypothetical protein